MKKILFITGSFLCLISTYSCSNDDIDNLNLSPNPMSDGLQQTLQPPPSTPPLPTTPHGDDDQDKDKTKH